MRWALAAIALVASACGGASPLLHPAHVLPANHVTFGAGVSGHVTALGTKDALDAARSSAPAQAQPSTPEEERTYFDGALTQVLVAPGVAPWVGARAGVGHGSDAGLVYSGRAVRVDGRHALAAEDFAISAGVGFTGILTRPGSDPPVDATSGQEPARAADGGIGGLDAGTVSGWGIDVPVIGGWRSRGDIVRAWAGPRGGYEQLSGEVRLQLEPNTRNVLVGPIEGRRWHVGGLVGLAFGLEPVWVALEIQGSYQWIEGHVEVESATGTRLEHDADVRGMTVSPAGAIIGKF